ncbi:TfoX/Sxy family transcriptional regulator of competence genes [Janibacter sp. UYMM211]
MPPPRQTGPVAYDEVLARRIRQLLGDQPGTTERAMFGGLGFMVDGHLAVAAGSRGALMVRADETDGAHPLLAPMEMRGRTMSGWYETAAGAEIADDVLAELVEMALRRVATLPPKG